jgi:peptidoglycan hydrolase-like protein with peptidoglycan-binding domain
MSSEAASSGLSDPNSILFEYEPTGASVATARQDRLPERGLANVAASEEMAKADSKRVMTLKEKFIAAGEKFSVPPALLAGIASRESRGGSVLKKGFGDRGNGFGVMQVDKRYHTLQGTDDPYGLPHIMQGAGILRNFIDQMELRHASWPRARQMQGGVSAYNQGPGGVRTLDRMDVGSTGNDYSNDVWARARYYAREMGSLGPPTPFTPSLSHAPDESFPAPALPAVLVGDSTLRRRQWGDSVVTLQNALMSLEYLRLTDDERSGIGTFGHRTEAALTQFQLDVYLPPTGVCDALTFTALAQLLSGSVRRGNVNQIGIVRRLQDRLVAVGTLEQGRIGGGYGIFGELTEGGLKMFQQAQGRKPDGTVTVATYLELRRVAGKAPASRKPSTDGDDTHVNVLLPRAGDGFVIKSGTQEKHHFATERTVNRLMYFALEWLAVGGGVPLRVGDLSQKGGGDYWPHGGAGHRLGFGVDLGLFRKDRQNAPTNYHDPTYDRVLTQKLVTALGDSPLVVRLIFNDPNVTGKKLQRDKNNRTTHDNHIHVEFR